MKYNVTLIDPATYKYAHLLTDICRTIMYGLRELGHQCDLTVNSIEGGYTNIIVGGHLLTAEDVSAVLDSGAQYIVLQSEALSIDRQTGAVSGAFHGPQYGNIARPLFERAHRVWDGISDMALLAKLGVAEEKVGRFGMGYARGVEDVEHRPYYRKDIDVLFFGSLTPYRKRILASLQGLRVVTFDYGPSAFRNDLIARAKINLSLHSSAELTHVEQGRVAYLLNNKALIMAEPATDYPPMRQLPQEVRSEQMRACCLELLADLAEIETRAEAAYQRFTRMRMADILAGIL